MNNPQHTRANLLLISGMILVTSGLIFSVHYLYSKADRARRVQIALRKVEAQSQDISSIAWEAIARHALRPELLTEFERNRRVVVETAASLAAQNPQSKDLQEFKLACTRYLQTVDRELELARSGRFEEAKKVDEEEADPSFDVLEQKLNHVNEDYDRMARKTVDSSEVGLVVAIVLWTGVTVAFFRQLEVQRHRAELALVGQLAMRQSEHRFSDAHREVERYCLYH